MSHLWPQASIVVFLAAIYGCIDAALPRNPGLPVLEMACGAMLWLAAMILIISVIHEDRLTGNRQFWVTRPYS